MKIELNTKTKGIKEESTKTEVTNIANGKVTEKEMCMDAISMAAMYIAYKINELSSQSKGQEKRLVDEVNRMIPYFLSKLKENNKAEG